MCKQPCATIDKINDKEQKFIKVQVSYACLLGKCRGWQAGRNQAEAPDERGPPRGDRPVDLYGLGRHDFEGGWTIAAPYLGGEDWQDVFRHALEENSIILENIYKE